MMICRKTSGHLHPLPEKLKCASDASNLKVAPCRERKGGAGSLLGPPALAEEGVSDEDSLLQARVQVKSDVAAVSVTQVHAEPGGGRKGSGPAHTSHLQVSQIPVCAGTGLSRHRDAASYAQTPPQPSSERNALLGMRSHDQMVT